LVLGCECVVKVQRADGWIVMASGGISSSSSSSEEGARVELGKVATLEVTQHLAGQDGSTARGAQTADPAS